MNEIKLKPCPFCGGEAVMYHQSSKYTDHDGDYVYCMSCGCRTKLFECFNGTGKTHDDTEREAMQAWNGRLERTGVWLDLPDYGNGWYRNGQQVFPKRCSVCGIIYSKIYNFCPTCGAKMKGGME